MASGRGRIFRFRPERPGCVEAPRVEGPGRARALSDPGAPGRRVRGGGLCAAQGRARRRGRAGHERQLRRAERRGRQLRRSGRVHRFALQRGAGQRRVGRHGGSRCACARRDRRLARAAHAQRRSRSGCGWQLHPAGRLSAARSGGRSRRARAGQRRHESARNLPRLERRRRRAPALRRRRPGGRGRHAQRRTRRPPALRLQPERRARVPLRGDGRQRELGALPARHRRQRHGRGARRQRGARRRRRQLQRLQPSDPRRRRTRRLRREPRRRQLRARPLRRHRSGSLASERSRATPRPAPAAARSPTSSTPPARTARSRSWPR